MNSPPRILVVDDEEYNRILLERLVNELGYQCDTACDGLETLAKVKLDIDLVLLDVVMPDLDGWQTCSRIREVSDVPIIMLTGKYNAEDDIVSGLDYGADEYLIKPVGNKELVARVRATLRRADLPSNLEKKKQILFGDNYLTVDVTGRKVVVNDERVRLTPREFRLLALLVENAGDILTHQQVLEKVWGWEYINDVDYVRIYIAHLRQKLEPEPSHPKYILTEPGVGYYFQKVA